MILAGLLCFSDHASFSPCCPPPPASFLSFHTCLLRVQCVPGDVVVTGSQQGTLGQGLRFLEWTVQSGRWASPPVNGHTAENRKRGPSGGRRGEAVFPRMVKAAVLLSQGGSRFLCQERRRGRGAGSGCARAGGGDCHPPIRPSLCREQEPKGDPREPDALFASR